MPSGSPRFASLVVALVVFAVSLETLGAGRAQANKQKAREFYRKGMAEYVLEHWDAAIGEFEAGFREEQEGAFLFNIAQAHRKAKRYEQSIQYFRKYLDFAPEAPDRAQVEKDIAEEEVALSAAQKAAREAKAAPPVSPGEPAAASVKPDAGTTAVPVEGGAVPATLQGAQGATPLAEAPNQVKKRSRWPLWVGLGAAVVVVAGIGLGVGLAATTPNDAPVPASSLGGVSFP